MSHVDNARPPQELTGNPAARIAVPPEETNPAGQRNVPRSGTRASGRTWSDSSIHRLSLCRYRAANSAPAGQASVNAAATRDHQDRFRVASRVKPPRPTDLRPHPPDNRYQAMRASKIDLLVELVAGSPLDGREAAMANVYVASAIGTWMQTRQSSAGPVCCFRRTVQLRFLRAIRSNW